ncbi:hypothetical protein [Kosakonia sacchari]|uniref:hypothetical protein n=1 Tax=Kosakonia sacchari TaxID=1158459 RepID=UPI00158477AE|nr:hypothetical protein [Kosakonia sacchari]NUL35087.1 hypothetical protein [Kosakonia sacchari]
MADLAEQHAALKEYQESRGKGKRKGKARKPASGGARDGNEWHKTWQNVEASQGNSTSDDDDFMGYCSKHA